MSMKELISLQSVRLPKKNSFTGILKELCLFIYKTTVFFLIRDTLKTDGTEEFLHSTDEKEEKRMILTFQICKALQISKFLVFKMFAISLVGVFTFRFDLHYHIVYLTLPPHIVNTPSKSRENEKAVKIMIKT